MKYLRKNDLIMLGLGLVIFAVLQTLITERIMSSFWQLNSIIIGINVIMAVSLNLINGYTGQFSLGHAGFMAVGAYVGVVLTTFFHLPFAVALLAGGAAAGFLGFLVGIPTLRLRGDYLAIATLGMSEIIRISIMNIDYVGGAAGFKGIPHHTTFAWVFFIMLFALFFIKNFVNSTDGRACLAIRENEVAAESMGVNTTKYKVMALPSARRSRASRAACSRTVSTSSARIPSRSCSRSTTSSWSCSAALARSRAPSQVRSS